MALPIKRAESKKRIYPKEARSKAMISGSIIDEKIILNLITNTKDNLESIGILDGELIKEDVLRGSFLSDVAFQQGNFCARKINTEELKNRNLYCDL